MSSGKLAQVIAGRRMDPLRFRALYPDRWRSFLHAHFRDEQQVMFFFSIDPKTAKHWWEGTHSPQAWAVDYAAQEIPGAREWLEAA